jgi:hypothetical protein
VLGGEGVVELLGLPELRRYVGWGDELVRGGALAAGAKRKVLLCVELGVGAPLPWWQPEGSHRQALADHYTGCTNFTTKCGIEN